MADQISTVRVKIEGGQEVTLILSFLDASTLPTLRVNQDGAIQIDVEIGDGKKFSFVWEINFASLAYLFDVQQLAIDPTAQCIAQCLGIAVGKGLTECLWKVRGKKGADRIKAIKDCLKEKGIGVLVDSSVCIAHCLGVLPSP